LKQKVFECRICSPLSSESAIRSTLEIKLPFMRWDEGDSSWDKVRVSGKNPRSTVTIYRYESPGPFQLTIVFQQHEEEEDLEDAYRELRDQVLKALEGRMWKPLQPQTVTLIKLKGRFPSSYEFECDRTMTEIKGTLDDAEFWYWETVRRQPQGLCLEGRIPFSRAGRAIWSAKERLRITGEKPSFSIEVGLWEDEPQCIPSCDQVHEMVQNTLLPAIGAHNVRAADGVNPLASSNRRV
jgi:hypothetical protein